MLCPDNSTSRRELYEPSGEGGENQAGSLFNTLISVKNKTKHKTSFIKEEMERNVPKL